MVKVLSILLSLLPAMVMAQVVEVNVSVLSGESSNERVGVVIKKDAETEEFYNLVVELKNHSDKVNAINAVESRKNDDQMENESFAKIEELRKKGILSEDDYLQMKASLTAQFKKNNQYTQELIQQASGIGSTNPSALKERIRSYCVGKRFFYSALNEVDGMVRVETRTADGKRRMGYIDVTIGRVVIEPNRYSTFNHGTTKGFTKDGYIIGHSSVSTDMLDRSGRVVLTGYKNLYFYNDCRILKAVNSESKVGIIDYQGNVLEPFVHSSVESESLAKAANRIFKEKGGEKVEIW